VGTAIASSSPITIAGAATRPSAAPELGMHTAEVLRGWLGLTTDQLAELRGAASSAPRGALTDAVY
jgi:crotonobetainyl-CoA:carnitine CoA-transferase CaiB-like acyl-CoA transferase